MEATVVSILLLFLLLVAVITDLAARRIPNLLVLPFWLLAPAIHFLLAGVSGLLASLAGLGVALGVGLVFWLPRWLGAGDVKLMAAVGGLVTVSLVWQALAATALCGLVLALSALAWRGMAGRALQRYWASIALTVAGRKAVYIRPEQSEQEVRLAYALAIAGGTAIVWLMHLGVLPV